MSIDTTKVSVDDTDPQIQWNGPWFTTQDFYVDTFGNGSPFLNTMHGIRSNGSLTFSFYGRWVAVWGSLTLRNGTLGPDPYWRCVIDGSESKHPLVLPSRPYSNYPFCLQTLREGNHTLRLDAIIQTETLYIDVVQYTTGPGADVGSAWTEVSSEDARFTYSHDWTTHENGYWKWTYKSGAWLTYDFNGTGVIWGGYTPRNTRAGPGKAQYQIDGGELKTFVIPQPSDTANNQAYFNVTKLKPGPHRLTVTNAGDESTAALGINYIYTKNASTTPRSSSAKVIGAAVGGSLGAVLLAVLGILAVIWFRRRQRQRGHDASSIGGTTLGKAMSITSGSTDIRELHTPVSPTQGPWSQPAGFAPHQHSIVTSNGEHSPTTLVAPQGPYQPAASWSGAIPPTIPPTPNRPNMFVTPSNPRLQRGPSASSGMPPPASIAAATNGPQSPVSFAASPSGSSPTSPTFFNPISPTAAGTQQNAWPAQVPVPLIQDGRHDHGEYHPNR